MDIKNKNIVITGASDGIGLATANKLAEYGANLVLIARNTNRLEELEINLQDKYPKQIFKYYICDLTDSQQISASVNRILSDFRAIHALLNIAGIWQKISPIESINYQTINQIIQTNLTGLIVLTSLLINNLKQQSSSAIINVSSRSGCTAQPGQSVYSASKWGVAGFTEVLKLDLKDTSVKVAGIYQGKTRTNIFNKVGDNFDLSKATDPNDLADTIVFMLTRPQHLWLHDVRIEY